MNARLGATLKTIFSFVLVGTLAAPAGAGAVVLTSSIFTGNVGADVSAYACAGGSCAGSLEVAGAPAGSTILKATLYGNNYFGLAAPTATFAGTPLGPTTAYDSHLGFSVYQWDVTPLVTGNGSYSASYSGLGNTYGLALVTVFTHPSLPAGTVFINQGAYDVNGGAGGDFSTAFAGAAGGAGTLWIHTAADNALGESAGEEIRFNGSSVGGPVDANLGNFASLFEIPVAVLSGLNLASLHIPVDQFGWDLAVLVAGPAGVAEPGTLALLGCALAGLALRRRPRFAA